MEKKIVIIGAGPAGLMAAERLAQAGLRVVLYERKASPARKFLMAGRGGLNLTHSEDLEKFITRYGAAQGRMDDMIHDFTPSDLRDWCKQLGEDTFVGSSGRVFPISFKASPLLRAWLKRLEGLGVVLHLQRTWRGWTDGGDIIVADKDGKTEIIAADAVLLCLGGASWPGLGSDGSWVDLVRARGVKVHDLRAANCGFVCDWSDIFVPKFAGSPLKSIALTHQGKTVRGEIMIAQNGIEGGALYALSSHIRTTIEQEGEAHLQIDLRPDLSLEVIAQKLGRARDKKSFSNYLRTALHLSPLEINTLRECQKNISSLDPEGLAHLIKNMPLTVTATFPLDRAISTAGGIDLSELDENLMLKKLPGIFVAGEMLDWEAPTGGYLLQGCFAMGVRAARGIINFLK